MVYPVKYIHSNMRGAPVVRGNAPGSVIEALQAALVTGFGAVAANSVVVAGGIATASLNAGETFEEQAVIDVSGATSPAQINSQARVLTSTATQITFATTAPDGPVAGLVAIKYAGAGWAMPYSSPTVGVFQSKSPISPQHLLRVSDAEADGITRVRGFETMSDLDTGIGPFPSEERVPGGGRWVRAFSANATPIPWLLVADDQFFFWAPSYYVAGTSSYTWAPLYGFGDPLTDGDDVWATTLSCQGRNNSTNVNDTGSLSANAEGNYFSGVYSPRAQNAVTLSPWQSTLALSSSGSARSGNDGFLGAFPDFHGAHRLSRRLISTASTSGDAALRGYVPGLYHMNQTGGVAAFAHRSMIDGNGPLAGRKLLAVHCGTGYSAANYVNFIDVTGPWR